ncbi:MAG: cell wall hydrolase [Micavibrio sp.]|nr:cell wall hydrolase [Micavibrio sp.]
MKKPTLTPVGGKAVPENKDAEIFYRDLEIDTLARTLWGEARGEGHSGMEAVAHVILNRVKVAEERGGKYWWGSDIISVCQKPYQFSCWNRSDPNYQKLTYIDEKDIYFATAKRISRRVILGAIPDPTGGATHYHTDSIRPYWAKREVPLCTIGRHLFYRLL